LNGDASSRLDFTRGRTRASLMETLGSSFARPGLEVDRRIPLRSEGSRLDVQRRLFGRISLRAAAFRSSLRAPEGETFAGVDLGRTLTQDSRGGRLGIQYDWTVKTALVFDASLSSHSFPRDATRDAHVVSYLGGIETS